MIRYRITYITPFNKRHQEIDEVKDSNDYHFFHNEEGLPSSICFKRVGGITATYHFNGTYFILEKEVMGTWLLVTKSEE